jgi:hypothetical protein
MLAAHSAAAAAAAAASIGFAVLPLVIERLSHLREPVRNHGA